ncbi:hypothetical protein P344_00405 [Spiroplasma mirum ATCC 29335]|uniref:Uncharacterized protein n=1 Tax=Spiroplasma mirum ATCC 29335 TaxID=838561 RepID=W0GPJ4_9MOLU|nr:MULTISPECIES: hypothetical protein [Spiroplasma]AHF60544.1 hypothetical protein SMM_0068 [Spiroplasma mirum ATCC 29335]AHI57455.1 hypothetical protein P344_00405 [Spiroplasma mirum ATCC 29335]AKM52667.1 hypothetical protein SATRI_v1c00710 [Spiroplasma atrichopogonis]
MKVADIKLIIKKIKFNLLWLFIFLALSSIIVLLAFIFSKINPTDKLTYSIIFIFLNLILLFINFLLIKNPFIFVKTYVYDEKEEHFNIKIFIYIFTCFIALVIFFISLLSVSMATKQPYSQVLHNQWYAGISYMLWTIAIILGFSYFSLIILNKKIKYN